MLICTVAPAIGMPSRPVTVPVILPHVFGGLTVIVTPIAATSYGVSVPSASFAV